MCICNNWKYIYIYKKIIISFYLYVYINKKVWFNKNVERNLN